MVCTQLTVSGPYNTEKRPSSYMHSLHPVQVQWAANLTDVVCSIGQLTINASLWCRRWCSPSEPALLPPLKR